MMAMTTRSSMSVKPWARARRWGGGRWGDLHGFSGADSSVRMTHRHRQLRHGDIRCILADYGLVATDGSRAPPFRGFCQAAIVAVHSRAPHGPGDSCASAALSGAGAGLMARARSRGHILTLLPNVTGARDCVPQRVPRSGRARRFVRRWPVPRAAGHRPALRGHCQAAPRSRGVRQSGLNESGRLAFHLW